MMLAAVVAVLIVAVASIYSTSALNIPQPVKDVTPRDKNFELKLVHVLFRHGARTPADTYPTDEHVNETFTPYGWGQLTNTGKQQMFELGEFLRNRYDQYLGRQLKLDEVHAQCTGVSRTKMSLQLVLAGLYPPSGTSLEWNKKLNWQPIPFNFEELNKDSLLLVRLPCPRYHEELERVMNEDVKQQLSDNEQLFEELSNITRMNITTPDDVQSLYSTLKAEQEFGLKLPPWTEKFFPNQLQCLTDKSYVINAYNSELKRLKGGVFVKKAIDDWKQKVDNKLKQKIFVYAGHDATVTNILSAFDVWEQQFPDYGVTAILELLQNKETKEFGVEIFLRNSTKVEPTQLIIPGCEKFCSLKNIERLLDQNIPNDWKSECVAKSENFTPPPLGGP